MNAREETRAAIDDASKLRKLLSDASAWLISALQELGTEHLGRKPAAALRLVIEAQPVAAQIEERICGIANRTARRKAVRK